MADINVLMVITGLPVLKALHHWRLLDILALMFYILWAPTGMGDYI